MKKFILLFIFLLAAQANNAQFLHLGIGVGSSKMKLNLNSGNEYRKWYFANLENEIIILNDIVPDEKLKLTASIYGTYITKNNFMLRTDMQLFYNESEIKFSNSTDTITYLSAFKGISGYQSMTFRYWFLSNSIELGYIFIPTKPVRPYIYAGMGMLTCLNIVQVGDYMDNYRSDRNGYIQREIVTFKRFSPKASFGVGLRYHSFSAEAYISNNIGNVDHYTSADERTYESYQMYGFTVHIDLISINLNSKTTKQKVKELGKFN